MRKFIADIGYRIYSWADGIAYRVNNKKLYLCCVLISTFLTAGIFYVLVTNGKTAVSSLGDWFVIIFCAIIITLVLGLFLVPAFLFLVACIEMFGFLLWQPKESVENISKVIGGGVGIVLFWGLMMLPMFVLMKSCDGDDVAKKEKMLEGILVAENDIQKELEYTTGEIMKLSEEIQATAEELQNEELKELIIEKAQDIQYKVQDDIPNLEELISDTEELKDEIVVAY